ncbi:MAG: hypothetical protein R6V83_12965 [Candidatus Thorarchaeota archaeon]
MILKIALNGLFKREEKKSEICGARKAVFDLDFMLTLYLSGAVSFAVLIASVIVFGNRLRSIYHTLTQNTKRSLVAFGISGVFLGLVPIQAIVYPALVPVWLTAFLSSLITSELYLYAESLTTLRIGVSAAFLVAFTVIVETLLRTQRELTPIALIAGLGSLLVSAAALGIYLLKESPSPFTGSIVVLIIIFVGTLLSANLGDVPAYPEYFMMESAPLLLTAAVLGTILKPWRLIVTVFLTLLGIVTAIALIIPAIIAGDIFIWPYVICAVFAGLACVFPLNYFIKQAVDTGTRTPLYVSFTLISVALLAITHSNAWSIAVEQGAWDLNLLYVDWIIGVVAVISFTLSSISLLYSERITNLIIDGLIFGGTALLALGHPFVSDGRYQLSPLYIPLSFLIAAGIIGFFVVAYKLRRAGSGGAASRFILFSFASLSVGIVAMFSDRFPFPLTLILLVIPGLMLVVASPYRPKGLSLKEVV